VPLRGTYWLSPERDVVTLTITPLRAAGRAATKFVDAIVRHPTPRTLGPTAPADLGPAAMRRARPLLGGWWRGPPWRGRGARALRLAGQVTEADLATVLAGRYPATGARLVGAQGSAAGAPGSASAPRPAAARPDSPRHRPGDHRGGDRRGTSIAPGVPGRPGEAVPVPPDHTERDLLTADMPVRALHGRPDPDRQDQR
jgi:hypothetical protein